MLRTTRCVQVRLPPVTVTVFGPGFSSMLTHRTMSELFAGVNVPLPSVPPLATAAENLVTVVSSTEIANYTCSTNEASAPNVAVLFG